MKRWVIVVLLLLIGCGNPDSGDSGSQGKAEVVLKGHIQTSLAHQGRLVFLGEVTNVGNGLACGIKVRVEAFDSGGDLLGIGFDDGPNNVRISGCLGPGEQAPFRIVHGALKEIPASLKEEISFVTDKAADSKSQAFHAVLAGDIQQSTHKESEGRIVKKYSGTMKNNHPNFAVVSKIVFAAFKGETLIDAGNSIVGNRCWQSIPSATFSCIRPSETADFSVLMHVPPEDITRFYFRISFRTLDCACQAG